MPYELESDLERELQGEWEGEAEWERSPGCVQDIPKLDPIKPKGLTLGRIQCPTRNTAFPILSRVVASAVKMLDTTIGELTRARDAACRGEFMVGPTDVARCWLKYRLGVCIDDTSTWTKSAFRKVESEPISVAEVIRRLVRPRNLIASNWITYVCVENDPRRCSPTTNAFVVVRDDAGVPLRTPDRIHLCPPFWSDRHAEYREQTIIHELVHMTHYAGQGEDRRV